MLQLPVFLLFTPFLISAAWCHVIPSPEDNKNSGGPIVTTQYGQLQGKVIQTEKGNCDAFFGVPFAAPPVGELRLKKPQPHAVWTGIRNATEFSPRCFQFGSNGNETNESEDCLYLNIFRPKSKKNDSLPVMVFIHGGGNAVGSADLYSEDGTCENLASRDVIVVIMQFRLNIYGFLSTGDDAALGNYGIWDQIEAMKWVKENVGSFGGDPNRVTLFGESAGGASVSYLSYTPVAKGLFQQAISQSGSAHCPWGELKDTSVGTTKKLAELANCPTSDNQAAMDCLRQLTTVELNGLFNSIATKGFFYTYLSIRQDGELFTQNEFQEIAPPIPTIIGVNTMEGSITQESCLPEAQSQLEENIADILGEAGNQSPILNNLVQYAYIDSKGDRNNATFLCQQISKMQADIAYNDITSQYGYHVGAALEANSKAAANFPVWVYNFDYYSENVFPAGYPFEKGATHAHELCYLFMLKHFPSTFSSQVPGCPSSYEGDKGVVADLMAEMWTNFAKTSNPSPKNTEWPQFHNISNANALLVQTSLSVQPHFYLDVTNFWSVLKPSVITSCNKSA